LRSRGADWVNLGRLYDPAERGQATAVTNGTNEWQMRNQMRAWVRYMTATMGASPGRAAAGGAGGAAGTAQEMPA
jgi:hypothetical protein